MSLTSHIPDIISFVKAQRERLKSEKDLFDIYEGGLLEKVDPILKNQLGARAAQEAFERMPPINILVKLTKKLSSLYIDSPERMPKDENDEPLVKAYVDLADLDSYMHDANIFFNLCKRTALEPYLDGNVPRVRAIPAHQFLVYSYDRINPTRPTVFIKFMGSTTVINEKKESEIHDILWLYTDDEIIPITTDGKIYEPDLPYTFYGVNPYGKIPFIYINASRYSLLPQPDDELLRMTLLVPILYSDINFGAKYQVFSTVYGIDIDTENLEWGPNVIWNFKSDEGGKAPSIGTIKPEVNMEAMTQSVTNQLATFFETRNLRGSTIAGFAGGRYGQQDSGGQAGVAILIQNLDTTELRKAHAKIFQEAESHLWGLLMNNIHPVWVESVSLPEEIGALQFRGSKVIVRFNPEYELKSDLDLVNEIQMKLNAGLISKRLALKLIYPNMSDEQIEALMGEIQDDQLRGIINEPQGTPESNSGQDNNSTTEVITGEVD